METINISTNKAYKMVVDGFACYVHVDTMKTSYDNQVTIMFEGMLSSYYHDSSNEEEPIEYEDELIEYKDEPSNDKKERGGFYKLMQKYKES